MPEPSGGNGDTGVDFDEAAFRAWAARPERSLSVDGGQVNSFSAPFIDAAVAFARDNWNRNTHGNNDATFNQLTRKFMESAIPGATIIITKGGKTFNNNNPLGSYMLGQKKQRAV